MTNRSAEDTCVSVRFVDLADLLQRIFVTAGMTLENARILALNCAVCERDGSLSHGIFRIPGYVASLKSGWADGRVTPTVEDVGAAFVRVNAHNGFAQPALDAARPALVAKARAAGAAVLAIRDSHHFSALWPDVEPFAREGFVALTCVGGLACVVPSGGSRAVFGTNPIAFATPVTDADPLVFDQATSVVSNGDVRIAARERQKVPSGAGLDRYGRPTVDPAAILDGGALLTFGGHKGASIALMVEILAAALTGGQFSSEVDFSKYPGAETPRTGQFLILINPDYAGATNFGFRVRQLIGTLRDAGQDHIPGYRRYARRRESEKNGILLSITQLEQLRSLCGH